VAILLLRLCAPLQSWGMQSPFTDRDTSLTPTKSGVIGLICAALGKPRDETVPPPPDHPGWPSLSELAALKMGVRIDCPGRLQRDYHTVGGWHRKEDSWYGVPTTDGKSRRTIVSPRWYLADAVFLVALAGNEQLLEKIYHALQHPAWQLYLGRKAFVPSCPVWLKDGFRRGEDDLKGVLTTYPYFCSAKRHPPENLQLELEVEYGQGHVVKPDQPRSFVSAERCFGLRHVVTDYVARASLPPAKEATCTCLF